MSRSAPAAANAPAPRPLRPAAIASARRAAVEALEGRRLFAGSPAYVWLDVVDGAATEGGSDVAVVRLSRDGSTGTALTVKLAEFGTALGFRDGVVASPIDPIDFTVADMVGGSVTIPAGAASVDLSIVPTDDGWTEADEVIGLDVADGPGYWSGGASVAISLADRPAAQTVTVVATEPVAAEAGNHPGIFTVRRTGDLSNWTRVNYEHTTTSGWWGEFGGLNGGSVLFPPGSAEQPIFIDAFPDAYADETPRETVTLTLRPGPQVTVGAAASATVEIADAEAEHDHDNAPDLDAWVGAGAEAGTNFGVGTELKARNDAAGGYRATYLTWPIYYIDTVAKATVEVYAEGPGGGLDGGMIRAWGVPDAAWNESTLTYDNRPGGTLWEAGSAYVGSRSPATGPVKLDVSDYVQRQKLLGAEFVTLMIAPDPSSAGPVDVTILSREHRVPVGYSGRGPRLNVHEPADWDGPFTVSHRELTVPEGGTASALALANEAGPGVPLDIVKVPGGDPDINAVVGSVDFAFAGAGATRTPIAFTAAPDADGTSGSATFVLRVGRNTRLLTVRESDSTLDAGGAPADTITVPITADGYADEGDAGATGGGVADDLRVRDGGAAAGDEETFLHVDLTTLPAADQISSATVRMFGGATAAPAAAGLRSLSSAAAAAPVPVSVFAAENSDWYWDEAALTWANRPATVGSAVASGSVGAAGWYDFDVAPLLRARKAAGAKSVSIALRGAAAAGGTAAVFASDESGANRPRLVVKRSIATVDVRASADAYVRNGSSGGTNYANANYGQATALEVKRSATASFARESYLKFDLSQAGSASGIVNGKLRLFGGLAAAGTGQAVQVYPVADTAWSESGLKWSSKPAVGTRIKTFGVSSATGGWFEVDVTAYLKQLRSAGKTTAAFALRSDFVEGQVIRFNSDEATANRPTLRVVKLSTPTPPATTKTIRAVADAHAKDGSTATQNFGGSGALEVKKSTVAGSTRQAFLRFDLTSVSSTVTSAKLRLYGKTSVATGSTTIQVWTSADTAWSESALTFAKRPALGSAYLKSFAVAGTAAKWYEVDLTAYVKAQKAAGKTAVTFALVGVNTPDPLATFNSDEATANRPELRVG